MSKDTKLIETLETHAETDKQTAAPELCAPASPVAVHHASWGASPSPRQIKLQTAITSSVIQYRCIYVHTYIRTYVHDMPCNAIPYHYITLHCITLHYITLHMYIYIYIYTQYYVYQKRRIQHTYRITPFESMCQVGQSFPPEPVSTSKSSYLDGFRQAPDKKIKKKAVFIPNCCGAVRLFQTVKLGSRSTDGLAQASSFWADIFTINPAPWKLRTWIRFFTAANRVESTGMTWIESIIGNRDKAKGNNAMTTAQRPTTLPCSDWQQKPWLINTILYIFMYI